MSAPFLPTMLPGSKGDPFSLWYLSPAPVQPSDLFYLPPPPILHVAWSQTSAPSIGQMRVNTWSTFALYGRKQSLPIGVVKTPVMLHHITQFELVIDPTVLPDGYGAGFAHPISDAQGTFGVDPPWLVGDAIIEQEWAPELALEFEPLGDGIHRFGQPPYNRAHRSNLNFGLAVTRKDGVTGVYIPVVGQYTVVTMSSSAPPTPVPPAVGSSPAVIPSGTANVVIKYNGETIWSIPVDPSNIVIDASVASIGYQASYDSVTAIPDGIRPFPNTSWNTFHNYGIVDNGTTHVFYATIYRYTGHVIVPLSDIDGDLEMVLPGTPLPYETALESPYDNPPLWNDFRASVTDATLDSYGMPAPLPIGVAPNTSPIGMSTELLPPSSSVPCRDELMEVTATGDALWEQVNHPAWVSGTVFTNPGDIGMPSGSNGVPVPVQPTDPTAVLLLPPHYLFYQCAF